MTLDLNKKNADGSVNSFYQTKIPGHGYHVPFNTIDFESQIEEHILPSVLLLNNNGYPTLTSCQGHSIFEYCFKNSITFDIIGPIITLKILQTDYKKISQAFSNIFFKVYIKTDLAEHAPQEHFMFIRLQTRKPWNFFFTNKFLCQQIYKQCKKIVHLN